MSSTKSTRKRTQVDPIISDISRIIGGIKKKGRVGFDWNEAQYPLRAQLAYCYTKQQLADPTVNGIGYVLADQIRRQLGTRDEFEIVNHRCGEPLRAQPKTTRYRGISDIADLIPIVFNQYDLNVDDAMLIAHMTMVPVQACSFRIEGENVRFFQPTAAAAAEMVLNDVFEHIFLDFARLSVKDKDLASALTSLRRQLDTENDKWKDWPVNIMPIEKKTFYSKALDSLIDKTEKEIDWKIEENNINAKLRGNTRPDLDKSTNAEYELTRQEKLLGRICPLFRDATPEIQRNVWSKLHDFTRNQWALFVIETHLTRKNYSSKADAISGIIKPRAKTIEEISGRTNMRGVTVVEGGARYRKDSEKVREIVNILKAAAVLRKTNLLRLKEN